jgi:hypothetical protein
MSWPHDDYLTGALAVIAVLASALSVALSPSAHAATATAHPARVAAQVQSATVIKVIRVTRPMKVVGFDAAIARAHGYTVHTNAHGQPYVTKNGAAVASPQNVEEGECGDSWIDYTAIGERSTSPKYEADFSTGYTLNAVDFGLAIEGYWVVRISDGAGIGDVETANVVDNGVTWSWSEETFHSVTGYSLATVLVSSYVYTDEGWICNSAGPYASTTLYA